MHGTKKKHFFEMQLKYPDIDLLQLLFKQIRGRLQKETTSYPNIHQ